MVFGLYGLYTQNLGEFHWKNAKLKDMRLKYYSSDHIWCDCDPKNTLYVSVYKKDVDTDTIKAKGDIKLTLSASFIIGTYHGCAYFHSVYLKT